MKKILALLAISIFLIGCTPTETAPVVEEEDTTTIPEVIVEEDKPGLPEGVEFNVNEEKIKELDEQAEMDEAADQQIAEDQKMLDDIAKTRPLTVEDCELVKNPEYKESCLVFASAPIEEEI